MTLIVSGGVSGEADEAADVVAAREDAKAAANEAATG